MARSGIETRAGGQLFRSRLEARWAIFFDLIGWRWTYEPFDADGYIPDFLVLGTVPVLIEVKPYSSFVQCGAEAKRITPLVRSVHDGPVLVVGCDPALTRGDSYTAGATWPDVERDAYPEGYDLVSWGRCSVCGELGSFAESWCQDWTVVPCGHPIDFDHGHRDLEKNYATIEGQQYLLSASYTNTLWEGMNETVTAHWREAGNRSRWSPS